MASVVLDGKTRPVVNTDPALHDLAHREEVVLVAEGPGGPIVLTATADGKLIVSSSGGSGNGFSAVDLAAFVEGAGEFVPVGGVFNEDAADVTEDKVAAARITTKRAIHVNLRSAAGVEQGTNAAPVQVGDGASTLSVDDAGASLSVDDGGGVLSTDSADGAHASLGSTADDDTDTTLIGRVAKIVSLLLGTLIVAGTKTNNAAAPGTNNLGTLPAVATAVDPSYIEGRQVALSVGLDGRLRVSVDNTPDVNVLMLPPVDQGTSPWVVGDGGASLTIDDGGVSISIDDGGNIITVDGTVATTTADGANVALGSTADDATDTTAIGRLAKIISLLLGTLTIAGTVTANQGTSPWVVGDGGSTLSIDDGGASITVDGTVAVTQGTSPWIVAGNKSNNTAAPGATNVGTLPAVAQAAEPVYTEGQQVALWAGLDGRLQARAELEGFVSEDNSSTALLGAAGVFTGEWEDISNFALVTISVFSDQRSLALDGLHAQFSTDGIDIDQEFIAPVIANATLPLEYKPYHQFFRVVYKNHESNAQGVFRLETIYHPSKAPSAIANLNGFAFVNGALRAIEKFNIDVSVIGPTEIVTAAGNRFSRIVSLYLTSEANQKFTVRSGTTAILPKLSIQPSIPFDINRPFGRIADGNVGQNINILQDSVFGPATRLAGFIEVVRV